MKVEPEDADLVRFIRGRQLAGKGTVRRAAYHVRSYLTALAAGAAVVAAGITLAIAFKEVFQ